MKRQKFLEGIPYTVQVLRWLGVALGAFLIWLAVQGLSVSGDNPAPAHKAWFLAAYGALLWLPWRPISRTRLVWWFPFLTLWVCSTLFLFGLLMIAFEASGSDRPWIWALAGILASLVLCQIVCVWIIREKKMSAPRRHGRRGTRLRERPHAGRGFVGRLAAIVPHPLGGSRDRWISSVIVGIVLVWFAIGLLTSTVIPSGSERLSLGAAMGSLSKLGLVPLVDDPLVRLFIWFLPTAVTLWWVFLVRGQVRGMGIACAIASLALPWFFVDKGLVGIIQFFYLPIAAFETTVASLAGRLKAEDYSEGALCTAALGWWLVLWACIAARIMFRRSAEHPVRLPPSGEGLVRAGDAPPTP